MSAIALASLSPMGLPNKLCCVSRVVATEVFVLQALNFVVFVLQRLCERMNSSVLDAIIPQAFGKRRCQLFSINMKNVL